jgi:hypothetical protein
MAFTVCSGWSKDPVGDNILDQLIERATPTNRGRTDTLIDLLRSRALAQSLNLCKDISRANDMIAGPSSRK